MSEIALPKPPRTKDDCARDYTALCNKVGHARYQIATLEKDIEMNLSVMRDLNLEAATLAAKEEKKYA